MKESEPSKRNLSKGQRGQDGLPGIEGVKNALRHAPLLYLAPLVVLVHVAEEAPGLVAWMNRRVEPDLTTSGFVALNAFGLLFTAAMAVSYVRLRNSLLALCLIAWLSFVMLTNGVLHLTASFVFREYVPGTVSAGLLYLPYFFAAVAAICRDSNIRLRAAVVTAVIGAAPMVAQGVGIIAAGRRILW